MGLSISRNVRATFESYYFEGEGGTALALRQLENKYETTNLPGTFPATFFQNPSCFVAC
jgi:hypothetical protein